nr:TfoX/Sxy family protein [Sphingomonas yunnanensis]
MAPLGLVTRRRMMGGAAVYLDGVIFALVTGDGALWFKSDAAADATWDAAGCERFRYARAGNTASINYRRAPEEVHDDADAMREWAMLGVAAGRRAAG